MATKAPVKKTTTIVNGVPSTTTHPETSSLAAFATPAVPVISPIQPTALAYPVPAPVGNIANQAPFNVNGLGQTPLTMAPSQTPVAASAGSAFLSAQAPQLQALVQGQQAEIQNLQAQDKTNQNGLQSIYQRLIDAPEKGEQIRQDAGVDQKLAAVNKYTSQIEALDVEARHAAEKVQKENKLGKGAEAIAAEVEQINRDALSKKADIAVLQAGAARDYDAASAAADRKIAAETETLKTALDAQKFFYQQNKDTLTKKEDQVWQVKLAQGEAELQLVTDAKKQAQNLIIEASSYGAPESVVKAAQAAYNQGADAGQIASIVGQYSKSSLDAQQARASIANSYSAIAERNAANSVNTGSSLASQASYNKLGTTQQAKADAANNLVNQLKDYRDTYDSLVKDKAGSNLTGSDSATLAAKANALVFAYSVAAGSGAVQEADRALIEKVIADPTSGGISGSIGRAIRGGKAGGLKSIDSQITQFTSQLKGYGLTPSATYAPVSPLGQDDLDEINSLYDGSTAGSGFSPATYFK